MKREDFDKVLASWEDLRSLAELGIRVSQQERKYDEAMKMWEHKSTLELCIRDLKAALDDAERRGNAD